MRVSNFNGAFEALPLPAGKETVCNTTDAPEFTLRVIFDEAGFSVDINDGVPLQFEPPSLLLQEMVVVTVGNLPRECTVLLVM